MTQSKLTYAGVLPKWEGEGPLPDSGLVVVEAAVLRRLVHEERDELRKKVEKLEDDVCYQRVRADRWRSFAEGGMVRWSEANELEPGEEDHTTPPPEYEVVREIHHVSGPVASPKWRAMAKIKGVWDELGGAVAACRNHRERVVASLRSEITRETRAKFERWKVEFAEVFLSSIPGLRDVDMTDMIQLLASAEPDALRASLTRNTIPFEDGHYVLRIPVPTDLKESATSAVVDREDAHLEKSVHHEPPAWAQAFYRLNEYARGQAAPSREEERLVDTYETNEDPVLVYAMPSGQHVVRHAFEPNEELCCGTLEHACSYAAGASWGLSASDSRRTEEALQLTKRLDDLAAEYRIAGDEWAAVRLETVMGKTSDAQGTWPWVWSCCCEPGTAHLCLPCRLGVSDSERRNPTNLLNRSSNTAEASQDLRAELERLRAIINIPQTEDWMAAVPLEAAHQIERWGVDHDAGKEPQDWFWLVGHLAGKALRAEYDDDIPKAKHHTISAAAVLLNWHRAMTGESTAMRPGIKPPEGGQHGAP